MPEMEHIKLGEHVFSVLADGPEQGAPVLLLHGFPVTGWMWRAPVERLAGAGFRAIAPDQRGYSQGARPTATDDYATEKLTGDALAIMDHIGARQFHLVGHDWGGQLSWLIAAQAPERLLSLTVLSRPHPAAFARAMAEDKEQANRSRHHRAFREADAIERMRAAKLEPLRRAMIEQGVPEADAEKYVRVLLEPGAIEGAMSWYRASNIAAASVPAVRVPTLFVWGDRDATVGRQAAELTKDYVDAPYRFEEIAGAGHFLVEEFPERVSELIVDHVRTHAKANAK